MQYLDPTLPSPAENLALDEALLLEAEAERMGEVLRCWELPAYAVIVGSGGSIAEEVNEAACTADGVPILRRCSGGGAVLLGPGCLCFSLVLSYERESIRDLRRSYVYILERIKQSLLPIAPGVVLAGTSDLALGELKVSGNSQRRLSRFLLHHGTLLCGLDCSRMERYLPPPKRQPAYRQGRDHRSFMTNLPASSGTLRQALRRAWEAHGELADWPRSLTAELSRDKYTQREWTHRR
jgi:lipoate-protein ligase A